MKIILTLPPDQLKYKTIVVQPNDKIGILRAHVHRRDLPVYFVYDGNMMVDDKSFKQNGIRDGATVKAQSERDIPKSEQQRKIKVNFYVPMKVPYGGKIVDVTMQYEILFFREQPISDVKESLMNASGYDPKDIIVSRKGVVLRNEQTLKEIGVVHMEELQFATVPGAVPGPIKMAIPGLTH
ncbi:hypothetical protein SAMD00019534_120580, partial [Acytostelium subglobosum LB1]|uniref:hypothetical protein n=1 Tax=Acytostelium subglobosum LB1 TaxID=1410327 RepID=UPI0006451442